MHIEEPPVEAPTEPSEVESPIEASDTDYPRIREAAASSEGSLWKVGDAIVAEAKTDARGHVSKHEYRRISETLHGDGYDWSPAYIRQLHRVTAWVHASAGQTQFRARPFDLVRRAKDAAKSDHDSALAILAGAKTKRDIPSKSTPDAPSHRGPSDARAESMAEDLQQVASARAQAAKGNGERIVGQVRDRVDEALRTLEDVVRATTNAIEHEPDRRADIEAILRRLEERGPELIATAGRAARATPARNQQLELEA